MSFFTSVKQIKFITGVTKPVTLAHYSSSTHLKHFAHSIPRHSTYHNMESTLAFEEVGNKNSIPLVLIHAFPLQKEFWKNQTDSLKEHARVLAIDLPGFGKSASFDENAPCTIDLYARSIYNFLDKLEIKKAVFAGCSLGGYVMYALWRADPSRIGGLIFCNTRCEADSEQARTNRYKTIEQVKNEGTKQLAENMPNVLWSAKMAPKRQQQINLVKQFILNAPPTGVIHASQAMATRPDSTELQMQINVPVLLITGSEDPITGPSVMDTMKTGMPHAKWVSIEDAGHLSPIDEPDKVNTAFIDFLQSTAVKEQFS